MSNVLSPHAADTVINVSPGTFVSSLAVRADCSDAAEILPLFPSREIAAREHVQWLSTMVTGSRSVQRGEMLYPIGLPRESLYLVCRGWFKSENVYVNGARQVKDFHVAGDLLGLDSIRTSRYITNAVALEDSEVFVIASSRLSAAVSKTSNGWERLSRLLGVQDSRERNKTWVRGQSHAERRVAYFLLHWAERLSNIGWPTSAMVMHMSRNDMASYLKLHVETVGRAFQKLKRAGWIDVSRRTVAFIDIEALRGFAQQRSGLDSNWQS